MRIQNLSCEGLDPAFLHLPFGEIAWALSAEAFLPIASSIDNHPFLCAARENVLFSLRYALTYRLSTIILPSLTTEMALLSFSGQLQANNSRERYLEFVSLALQEGFLQELFQRYPRLLESIEKTLSFWKSSVQLFLDHLLGDLQEIQHTFFHNKPLILHQISMDLSDLHHRGRSVFQVEFAEGKLIYKPKDLAVEKAFNSLLNEINALKFPLPLQSVKVLPKESYGWMEFVEHHPCQTAQEVKDFFTRSGINLFLWYLLEGTDAHYENLISCGAYPIMIDLETLFHPELNSSQGKMDPFKNSVLRTGLLPFIHKSHQLNYGGITASQDALVPQMFCGWAHINTDSMQLIRKTDRVRERKHLAHFNDSPISFVDYIEEICAGFSDIYTFFCKHKKHFLESAAFQDLLASKTRVVLRGTPTYSRLLQFLRFPAYLQSREKAEAFLDKALTFYPKEIQCKEKEQLLELDIPYFYSFPHSRNLYSSDDHCFKELLPYSMGELVKTKLENLNEKEELKQQRILKNTLQCFLKKKRTESQVFKKTGLQVAQLIAQKIVSHEQLLSNNDNSDMYNGRLGIALFFAAMYRATKEAQWKQKASTILTTSQGSKGLCAFSGLSSMLYVYLLLGQMLGNKKILNRCQLVSKRIGAQLEQCERLDLVGGLSGCITVLLACYESLGNKQFLELAIQGGASLLTKFKEEKKEMGLSHGLSGYALSLFRLYAHTKETAYINSAKEMIDLERSIYTDSSHRVEKNSWCHGYTGIGLSRLATLSLYDDEKVRQELELAVVKTKESIGDESSLCCGDFGRFEFLMEYAKKEKSHQLEMDVRQLIFFYMNEYLRTDGENCSLKENYQWGFMQGITGIGYSLLRLTGLCKLPQVLLLNPH